MRTVGRTARRLATIAATSALAMLAAAAPASAAAPTVVTGEASEVTRSSMKLCGTVNPNGESTTYQFDYEHYENGWRLETSASASAGNGESAIEVCTTITGLKPETTYWYRIVAKNASGEAVGAERPKRTLGAVEGVETLTPTEVTVNSAMLHGKLEPNGYDTHYYFRCGGQDLPEPPGVDVGSASEVIEVEREYTGLNANTQYSCRLVASNELGTTEGFSVGFTTAKATPVVDGTAPSVRSITATSAVVYGTVNTQNEATAYRVQYVSAAEYEPSAEEPYAHASASAGGEIAPVSGTESSIVQGIEGLAPQTTYHYRLVAENATGATYGPDNTFTTAAPTLPLVSTGAASAITATTATITGTVNPQGLKTSYEFQIGQSAAYEGTEIFGNAGDSETAEQVSTTLQFLTPGTTYHYRIIATNVYGTTYGPDETFTTPTVPSPIAQPPATPILSFAPMTFPTEQETPPLKTKKKAKHKHKHKHKHHKKKK